MTQKTPDPAGTAPAPVPPVTPVVAQPVLPDRPQPLAPGAPDPREPSVAALAKSVRRMRIWLIALTAFIALALVAVVGAVALFAYGIGGVADDSLSVDEAQVAKTKSQIEDAFGDRLKSVEVRVVTTQYGEAAPFPFSAVTSFEPDSLYVEYRIKGSNVVVADVVSAGMYGEDLATYGLLPTQGSLTSRLTQEEFERLLAAYEDQTSEPLSAVLRYGDGPYAMESGQAVPDEITVGDGTYLTSELWSATQGRIVEGDRVDMDAEDSYQRTAFIFRKHPETGEFQFLGTEPSSVLW